MGVAMNPASAKIAGAPRPCMVPNQGERMAHKANGKSSIMLNAPNRLPVFQFHRPAPDGVLQSQPVQILHRNKRFARAFANIVNRTNVGIKSGSAEAACASR